MIAVKPFVGDFAKLGFQLQEGDQLVGVPNTVFPVTSLYQPLKSFGPGDSAALRASTFADHNFTNIAPSSAASNINVCSFSAGIWQMSISWWVFANFAPAIGSACNTSSIILRFLNEGSTSDVPIAAVRCANALQQSNHAFSIFSPDPFRLNLLIPATGVGQNIDLYAACYAIRIH